jgi:cell pole-organizing protein PopZ
MANPSTAHEPSMEEILASIRQIISEDGEGPSAPRYDPKAEAREEPEPAPEPELQAEAVEIEAEVERPDPTAGWPDPTVRRHAPTAGKEDFMKAQISESPTRPASPSAAPPAMERRQDFSATGPSRAPAAAPRLRPGEGNLLSADSDAAVSGAFSALAHTILAQNARTLEDLVVEMLQPMLKEWLDDNLPSLVEKLVQEEIERVSRGRR